MEEDILGKVVEVEKEIRKRLEAENEKAAKWLANAGEEAKREVDSTKERLEGTLDAAISEARAVSEEKASRIIGDAKLSAEGLEGLGSEKLREIILRHISNILPGD
jgi:vacuolar-type H+-ATPase subunit H